MGLSYVLDRQEGPQRRARLREKARAYWRITAPRQAPQHELRRAWRFYQGRDTQRVDAHTRKPAQAGPGMQAGDYEGIVLYSEPFLTRDEAEAWARPDKHHGASTKGGTPSVCAHPQAGPGQAWYAEPGDYEGIVLYSSPFSRATRLKPGPMPRTSTSAPEGMHSHGRVAHG